MIPAFIAYCRDARRLAPSTVRIYARYLNALDRFGSPITIESIRAWLASDRGKVASRGVRMAALHTLAKWLELQGERPDWADRLVSPKVSRPHVPVPGVAAVLRMIDGEQRPMERLILELLYGGGLRVGELVALDVTSVRWDSGRLAAYVVHGKGDRDRVVPLGRHASRALRRWLGERPQGQALFPAVRGARISTRRVWEIVSEAAGNAGLGHLHPHQLRHACATHMHESGCPIEIIQVMLGHRSVSTTMRYVGLTLEHVREAYSMAHPRAQRGHTVPKSA